MELIVAAYLVIAGVFYAGQHDGIFKDDNYERTVRFEKTAHELELNVINENMKRHGWSQDSAFVCEEKSS